MSSSDESTTPVPAQDILVRPPAFGEERPALRRINVTRSVSECEGRDGHPAASPSMRVRFILGEDDPENEEPLRPIFSEMEELSVTNRGMEWKETARWIKFEETVEDGGCRWSKPYVGTLSLHALFEFRSYLLNGVVLLDAKAGTLGQVAELALEALVADGQLAHNHKNKVRDLLRRPHRHLYEIQKHVGLGKTSSSKSLAQAEKAVAYAQTAAITASPNTNDLKGNTAFLKKIPPGAEVMNVLVGELDFLEKPIAAFVRLNAATVFGGLTEVPLPTRFIYLFLGPTGGLADYREVGRVAATLLADEVFHEVAYRARNRDHLLAGVDEFLDAVTVLPPGEWDPNIRIEPPKKIPSQEPRKNPEKALDHLDPEIEELRYLQSQGLVRTGRLFGGLVNDIKRKAKWYVSDFTDAFSMQCVATICFLYFASLSPIITFGGLLSDATEDRLGALESLCAGCVCGVIFGLFSGQPLSLLNATGPVLVFESILYNFCKKAGYYYLTVRLWVGVWMGVYMLILCAFDVSAWVCYVTRFTEENFALLIATVYLYKAVEKLIEIAYKYPIFPDNHEYRGDCFCYPTNESTVLTVPTNWTRFERRHCMQMYNGTLMGEDCFEPHDHPWYPNVFFMSICLAIFTHFLCVTLKNMKHSIYFPNFVRKTLSDFAVFIVIVSMTVVDFFVGVKTPKLSVPGEFKPTWSGRGWLTPFVHPDNPWWIIPACMLPALLSTILLFLDQQITAVIVNRREHKLKKGCGYHLDLLVLAFLTALMGILGLPWHVAGTVICINHINSLKHESETAAPGDKPQFLGIREQRVTHICIFLLVGLSVFMTPVLQFIPMPVLYGVFLYMGTAPLAEMQFYDRVRLFFIPLKYQPDYNYLRQVRLSRVHLYTIIQLACFAMLWVVKTNDTISISFPAMLVVMIVVRKCLDYVFTKDELRALDMVIPPFNMKMLPPSSLDEKKDSVPELNGDAKLPNIPSKVNISDEVVKSGVWHSINRFKKYQPGSSEEGNGMILSQRHTPEDAKDSEEVEPLSFTAKETEEKIPNGRRAPLAYIEEAETD